MYTPEPNTEYPKINNTTEYPIKEYKKYPHAYFISCSVCEPADKTCSPFKIILYTTRLIRPLIDNGRVSAHIETKLKQHYPNIAVIHIEDITLIDKMVPIGFNLVLMFDQNS